MRRNSSARALGMYDFCRLRQRCAFLPVFRRDHLEYVRKFGQSLYASVH